MSDSILDVIRESFDIEDEVLQELGLRPYPMYLVNITAVGEDKALGIRGTVTKTETEITPTPRAKTTSFQAVAQSGGYLQAGDMIAFISAKNYTSDQIQNANFIKYQDFLWKVIAVHGHDEDSTPFQWKVIMRKHSAS